MDTHHQKEGPTLYEVTRLCSILVLAHDSVEAEEIADAYHDEFGNQAQYGYETNDDPRISGDWYVTRDKDGSVLELNFKNHPLEANPYVRINPD